MVYGMVRCWYVADNDYVSHGIGSRSIGQPVSESVSYAFRETIIFMYIVTYSIVLVPLRRQVRRARGR